MLEHAALAYIDPASGVLLLQLLLAGALGVVAFFRRSIWGFVHRLFGGKRKQPALASDDLDERK